MKKLLAVSLVSFLAGCFTVREPVCPPVTIPAVPQGRDVRVQLAGYEATVTTYVPTYGYTTVTGFSGGHCHGRRHCHGGVYSTTVQTTEFVPHTESTPVFRDRAADLLEQAGCLLQTSDPQYRVEVHFEGPFTQDGDGWATAGWMFLTLFTADYGAQEWVAKLRVHDLKTGRLVLSKDLVQRYEAVVWGPLPLLSPMGSDKTSHGVMKSWCLSALTDQTVAEAASFLAAVPAP